MSLIISTVRKEKQRIDYMLEKYREMLAVLPKGSISEKKVNGYTYCYLKYRDGKKWCQNILGKMISNSHANRLKSDAMWKQ
ncbi:MAG: hypothetical protein Q4F03_11875 [Eubacteriales bacterium]|nr:hypothetical protein [Eubacteriales bacterium]